MALLHTPAKLLGRLCRYTAWCIANTEAFQSETSKSAADSLEQNCFGWEIPDSGNTVLAPSCLVTIDYDLRDGELQRDRSDIWLTQARLMVQLFLIEDPDSKFVTDWDKLDHAADRMCAIMDAATDQNGHDIDGVNWKLHQWSLLEPLTRNRRGDNYRFVDGEGTAVRAVVGTFATQLRT